MLVTCREAFLRCLKCGKLMLLGTCVGYKGMLTTEHPSRLENSRRDERDIPLHTAVKVEIENRLYQLERETYIGPFVPVVSGEVENGVYSGDEIYKETTSYFNTPINPQTATVTIAADGSHLLIKDGDTEIKRVLAGTSYYGENRGYRTSYFFGGNVKVHGKNYCFMSECIDFEKGNSFTAELFVMYAIATDNVIRLRNKVVFTEKVFEEVEDDTEGMQDSKPKGKGKRSRRKVG